MARMKIQGISTAMFYVSGPERPAPYPENPTVYVCINN